MFGKSLSGRKIENVTTREPTSYEFGILRALQHRKLYQGTVEDGIKSSRRARGKVAKLSRKINRGQR